MSSSSSGGKGSSTQLMLKEVERALCTLDEKKLAPTDEACLEAQESLRRHVCDQTNARLTDLDKVAGELAKDSTAPGQSQVILDFLVFLMNRNPITFASSLGHSSFEPQQEKLEDDYSICRDLNRWLLSRLLRILSDYRCKSIHDKVCNVVLQLLKILRAKVLPVFKEVFLELLEILGRLLQISSGAFSHGSIESLEEPLQVEVFPSQPEKERRSTETKGGSYDFTATFVDTKPVQLQQFTSCFSLHLNLSKILFDVVKSGGIVGLRESGFIWALVCCQLEQAHFPLKQVSLDIMGSLLEQRNFPPDELSDYFSDLLVGILSLILEQTEDLQKYEGQADLERSLATCLNVLFAENSNGRPSICLPASIIDAFLEVIGQKLQIFGVNSIITGDLQEALAQVIVYLTTHIPTGYSSDPSLKASFMRSVSQFTVAQIGSSDKAEVFGMCLVGIIQEEFSGCDTPSQDMAATSVEGVPSLLPALPSESSDVSGDEKIEKKSRLSLARNLKKDDSSSSSSSSENTSKQECFQDMTKHSSTLQMLKSKVNLLCQNIPTESKTDVMKSVQGVHVGLAVIQRCSVIVDEMRSTQNPEVPAKSSKMWKHHLLSWFTLEELSLMTEYLVGVLEKSKELEKKDFSKLYTLVAECAGLLISISDGIRFFPAINQECVWILSLPWLQLHSSWMDLNIQGNLTTKEVDSFSKAVDEKIDKSCMEGCLHYLALFPKETSPKWRLSILRTALYDDSADIVAAGIKLFPYFLFHLGSNYNHLLQELIVPYIEGCPDAVAECMATSIGPILCVLNRQCFLKRSASCKSKTYSALPEVCCAVCSGRETPSDHIQAGVVSPFLVLLSRNQTIKLAFIKNFGRIFGHLDLQHKNTSVSKLISACMNLGSDPNQEVRTAFRSNIKFLVNNGKPCNKHNIEEVVSKLKAVFFDGKAHRDYRLEESVVHMLGELGKVGNDELLLVVIISLLDSLLSSSNLVKSAASLQLKDVASAKSSTLPALFKKFRSQICKFVVESMEDAVQRKKDDIKWIPDTIAPTFEFVDTKTFLSRNLDMLLPSLVKKASEESSLILRALGRLLEMKHTEMLVMNFKYVFSFLVRNCSKNELEKALMYVHRETEFDFSSLLRIDYQSFHNELLLHLSQNYTKVFSGLAMLAAKDSNYKGPRPINTPEDMADFLQPRLLGILAFFDSQLLNSHTPLEDRKLALESLVCIMRLMGPKHITGVRVKIMTTLKIGLRYKDHGFQLLSCRAWDCYVRSVEPSALGPMLSQIIVTLLPLLQELPTQVSAIFRFLIVENQEKFCGHFRELYFMPKLSELDEINQVLEQYRDHQSSQPDVRTQLREAMKGVAHDSVDVRVHALSNLRDLLYANQSSLHEFVMGSEDVDSIITELISVLLSGCWDSNPEAQSLFGECLGALGAVDPGRLDLATSSKKQHKSKVYTNVDDINFAYDLISELARGFLAAADTRAQDCSAYAIQEMLQIYECSNSPSSSGHQLWQKFPQHIQEILTPLLYTKYVPSHSSSFSSNVPKPIYRSAKGSTYKDWVCYWAGYLVNQVKQEKASRVFSACRVIIKHDINTALFLLPYLLQHVIIDSEPDVREEIQHEVLAVLQHAEKSDNLKGSEESHLSAQTVFSVLDHFTKWKQQRAQELMTFAKSQSKGGGAKAASIDQDKGIQSVTIFLRQIPQDVLARASFQCRAYARALMHLEAHLKSEDGNFQNHLAFLKKVYVALDEPDGVLGVSATRQEKPSLSDQILDHESTGKLGEAQACYEQAIKLEPDHLGNHEGLLKSLMDLGQLNTALVLVNGVLADKPQLTPQLNAYRVEACWKLSRWDSLETHLQTEKKSSTDWKVGLGQILLAAKNKNLTEFQEQLQIVRSSQMGPLSAASMEKGSYQRGYEFITRLHMLSDLERGIKQLVTFDHEGKSDLPQPTVDEGYLLEWNKRLAITQASFRVQEPLLCMQRIILGLSNQRNHSLVKQEIGKTWLNSAKVARKANQMQTAYSFLLNASQYSLPEFCLEKAKWLWNKGEGHQALICLQKGVKEHFSSSKSQQDPNQRAAHAKALLLIGRCMEDTAKFESNSVMKQYKEVVDIHPEWEDGHFYMAKYYDRLMLSFTDRPEKGGEFVLHVIKNFGQSLCYGNQHIYQSMPRLLSHWLDYGAYVADLEKGKARTKSDKLENSKSILHRLNKMIEDITGRLAPYQFLTSFSQLISRICHAHPAVFQQLMEIIANVIVKFPQQAVWMSMAVSKSTHQMRQQRCREIFSRAIELDKSLQKFVQDATKLTDRLLELCNKVVDRDCNLLSINKDFRSLKRLVTDKNFSQIIVPLQSLMTVTLPSTQTPHKRHDPFPASAVYICGFDDGVEVLSSLQQPKKIGIQGNDGRVYVMLCKPKDDLRKDNRLMEVNGIINKCLMKDADARWRQLHIRTYAVIPLNEECGLIEWVPNTSGLRHVLTRIYRQKGIYLSSQEIKALFPQQSEKLETKLMLFKEKLLPKFPPVFGEWFLKTFPDPTSWYLSRLAFARTAAVMSMVGYILGLGDRHGENILMDSIRGDCVHVDFNCLFNKGETFDWPERVPFRLTHNMLDGMGPLGFEGVFRRACEVTMTVMRDQKDPLMSVLKTLIYDPLVEWSKPSRSRTTALTESGEINNEKAQVHVRDIEQRLQGILKSKNKTRGLPLSIEGHVDHLIREATDPKNLCQMYVGWASYL
ncbi:Serine/threonine-protein kinase ATR [Holothuria leucospilota]|uniref:Serine/threonine-protein kinase ATR n=1 Tax=Holothuria leucospilota TaxID=206669 RepID=A0A9Q1H1G0_HOLLE|nr:Serine/threonine-protein kinase ATR [Holothuria leucospilota]